MGEALKTAAEVKAEKDGTAAVNPHDAFFIKLAEMFPGSIVFRDASEISNDPDPVWRPTRRLRDVPAPAGQDQRKPGAPPQQPRRNISE
jgi:hypothetical protein